VTETGETNKSAAQWVYWQQMAALADRLFGRRQLASHLQGAAVGATRFLDWTRQT
jgi:hypothetical protein